MKLRLRETLLTLFTFFALLGSVAWATESAVADIPYEIIAVRAPRYGDNQAPKWAEVMTPAKVEAGQELVLIHRDGSEEVLVPCASTGCAVLDPFVSFDGKSVYYAFFPDARESAYNYQRGLPTGGTDIYRLDLATRQTVRLTHQEFTPNTGVAAWAKDPLNSAQEAGKYRLGYGVINLGPTPFPSPDGREEWIAFVSSRNAFLPARGMTNPNLQLYIMDHNGRNVRQIGHFNLSSVLHPVALADGRLMFSSLESQGVRDERVWCLWAIRPDGTHFETLISAFREGSSFHFQTQLSDRRVVVTEYYNLNNHGFGTFLAFSPTRNPNLPAFGSAKESDPSNPLVRRGRWFFQPGHPAHLQPRYVQYAFSQPTLHSLTAFTHGEDEASDRTLTGEFAGKVTHPSGAPGNDIVLIYTTGPANELNRPVNVPKVWGGIYIQKGGTAIDSPEALQLVKRDPNYNYQQPRAVASYQSIYGQAQPDPLPFLPDATVATGQVGGASLLNRDTAPGKGDATYNGLDPLNSDENGVSTNWFIQGADAGKYTNDDVFAVRILAMEPSSHLSYGPDGYGHSRSFRNHAQERLRILGEIPVRKPNGSGVEPKDGDGNPDTSFKVKVPANVPFTFQTLDRNGMLLNMAQTWHQVRPGEERYDCGGCHAHAHRESDFEATAAARPDYQVADLAQSLILLSRKSNGTLGTTTVTGTQRKALMDVEYRRDIKPLLKRSCAPCHTSRGRIPDAGLDLDDDSLKDGYEKTYLCLVSDPTGSCGAKPIVNSKTWRQTNASRWIRMFQSRRSLLIWKIFGARLDGWTNSDHPTETTPGEPATLPAGANRNLADLDYVGTAMPPPNSGVPQLTADEKQMFVRWIELGAPSDAVGGDTQISGWFVDDLRPSLDITSPAAGVSPSVEKIEFLASDYYSGLQKDTLSVVANFPVNGIAAGEELAGQFTETLGRWTLPLATAPASGVVRVSIKDVQGNITSAEATFGVDPTLPPVVRPTPAPQVPRLRGKTVVKVKLGRSVRYDLRRLVLTSRTGVRFQIVGRFSPGRVNRNGLVTARFTRRGNYRLRVIAENTTGRSRPGDITFSVTSSGR